jgi:membrane associated rhomboid family serine protease
MVSGLVLAYLLVLPTRQRELFLLRWAAVPLEITEGDLPPSAPLTPVLTLLTSVFLHADLLHLGGNLFYLWVVGATLERRLGAFRYLGLYLACGVAGGALQVAASPTSMIPIVGASGAVAGLIAAYLVFSPRPSPRASVCAGWLLFQLVDALSPGAGPERWVGGPASWSHLGGLVAGASLAAGMRRDLALSCRYASTTHLRT